MSHAPIIHMHHLHKPTAESFGFWHPPTEVWYTKDETAHRICNDSGEDPHCSDKYILVRGFLVVCLCVWVWVVWTDRSIN